MNKCLLVACDLHNTLLQSSPAWEKAFTEISSGNKRQIADALMSKYSRHQLAKRLGISYEEVYKRYGELVEINQKVVSIICAL